MDKFQVIQPSPLLAPYIRQYWFLTVNDVAHDTQRLVPAGSIMLFFHRGGQIYTSAKNSLQPNAYVCGQSIKYSDSAYSGNLDIILVVFHPIGAKAFFKIPLNELSNQNVAIDALCDPQISELEKRLMEFADNETCVGFIENFLLKRIYQFEEYNHKRLTAVIKSINCGQSDILELAQTACLGYKQFKRIFAEHAGVNPKDFLRIFRFQKASRILQVWPQTTLIQLAEECGYSDKSHLIKEFKGFSGYTPGEYVSVCDPYSEYHSLFRSAFLETKD